MSVSVYVWLGRGTRESRKAMRYLQTRGRWTWKLSLPTLDDGDEDQRQRPVRWIQKCYDVVGKCLFSTSSGPGFDHLELIYLTRQAKFSVLLLLPRYSPELDTVLDSEWVRRSWTFQELLLARYPIIICGNQSIRWNDFIRSIHCARQDAMDLPSVAVGPCYTHIGSVFKISHQPHQEPHLCGNRITILRIYPGRKCKVC